MDKAIDAVFDRVSSYPELADKLREVAHGKQHIVFDYVTESAQPFVAAMIVRTVAKARPRVWIICENERAQERFHLELTSWQPGVFSFPHQEVAAVEGAVPDPEISAERLGNITASGGSGCSRSRSY